jgi:hypothetical protein
LLDERKNTTAQKDSTQGIIIFFEEFTSKDIAYIIVIIFQNFRAKPLTAKTKITTLLIIENQKVRIAYFSCCGRASRRSPAL